MLTDCPECGYSLAGLKVRAQRVTCPECAALITEGEIAVERWTWWWFFGWMLAPTSVFSLLGVMARPDGPLSSLSGYTSVAAVIAMVSPCVLAMFYSNRPGPARSEWLMPAATFGCLFLNLIVVSFLSQWW